MATCYDVAARRPHGGAWGAHDVLGYRPDGAGHGIRADRPHAGAWGAHDVLGRRHRVCPAPAYSPGGFPTQYLGLKAYYQAAVRDLCLVAEADAPTGMGGVIKISKGGSLYAVYLVETTDPDASPVRVQTSAGTKAIREYT